MRRKLISKQKCADEMIWANLLHLSYNMWCDRKAPGWKCEYVTAKPYLRFEEDFWNYLLHEMVKGGMNMVVIDLGDAVKYESHPEIAVEGAWTRGHLKKELAKIRKMGMEPIPKLNFSTCHDAWLGPYSRCVSTDCYYAVCEDLIAEVIELFDKPRFFHLGMDEETANNQCYHAYSVIRQHELWWHDFYFLVNQVEKRGVRPWIWSDYLWRHPDIFFKKMSKSVLQSNWYYGDAFNRKIDYVRGYLDLEAHGYDQIPTGSNWTVAGNFEKTVDYCRKRISPKHLLGFMQTSWKPTLRACRKRHVEAINQVGRAVAKLSR